MVKKVIVFVIVVIGITGLIIGLLSMPAFKGTSRAIDNFEGEIKEFNIIAKNWGFDPSVIEVHEGDLVRLNIQSVDVNHGFSLSEFGVNEFLKSGEIVEVEFIANKRGEFNFFCNVYCGSGHGGMKGKLVVR